MATLLEAGGQPTSADEIVKRGVSLLSQQVWCWGQDILRPGGNWLIEAGFQRLEAPADRDNCPSVYALELPRGRRVVLRGFGVFYGEDRLGGVFLPRYKFRPRFTPEATLECPPWLDADLPSLAPPNQSQMDACLGLTTGLIEWICDYEAGVAERLGTAYRQSTLDAWTKAKGPVVPADAMAAAWRSLGVAVAENPRSLTL